VLHKSDIAIDVTLYERLDPIRFRTETQKNASKRTQSSLIPQRRELPALIGCDHAADVGPFYSSDADSATYGGSIFVEFIVEREPELGCGG
jgi:hypothetical protein